MKLVLAVLCAAMARADPPAELSPSPSEDWSPFFGGGESAGGHHPGGTEERKDVPKVTITKKVRVPYTVHVEKRIPKIIEVPVDKPFNVYVPKPYPVVVEKKVPYEIKVPQPQPYTVEKRVPYPVKVLVDKPYTLHVPKPYPVNVEKKYEFTVEKKVPYEVKVPVERPYPVHVIVEKEVKFPVERKVPVPVKVPYDKPIPIHVTKHVPVNVDKPVPYTVEKVTTYPVKVPFSIPIKVHYPEGGSVDGNGSNSEWAEAVNSAMTAAKSEHQGHQGYSDAHTLIHHEELHRPHWQDHRSVRQGFSHGRGLPTRHGYVLGKHTYKRPTTKLQQVAHHYQVKESQFEHPHQYLSRPSHVIAPQMVLADPHHKHQASHGTKTNNTLQQPNTPNSFSYSSYSHPSLGRQNDTSPANHPQQLGSISSHQAPGVSSQISNQQTHYQPRKNSTSSFVISNVVYHGGTPQETRTPFALPLRMNRLEQPRPNSGSESAEMPSATLYRPTDFIRTVGNRQLANRTPFTGSGFTISFRSPGSAQQLPSNLTGGGHQLGKQHREASTATDVNGSWTQLFKPQQQVTATDVNGSRNQLFQQQLQASTDINSSRNQFFQQQLQASTDINNSRNQLFQQQQQASSDINDSRSQLFKQQQQQLSSLRTDIINNGPQLFQHRQPAPAATDVKDSRTQNFQTQHQSSSSNANSRPQVSHHQQPPSTGKDVTDSRPQVSHHQQQSATTSSNPQLFEAIEPHAKSSSGPSSYVTVRDSYSSSIQHHPPPANSSPSS